MKKLTIVLVLLILITIPSGLQAFIPVSLNGSHHSIIQTIAHSTYNFNDAEITGTIKYTPPGKCVGPILLSYFTCSNKQFI